MAGKRSKARDLNKLERQKDELVNAILNGSSAVSAAVKLTRSQLGEALLQRATIDLVEELDVPLFNSILDLAQSHLSCLQHEHFSQGSIPTSIKTQTFGSQTHWSIITLDRPFLVSSIMEWARTNGLIVSAMLHPILDIENISISFNYLVTDKIEQSRLEQLSAILTETMDLVSLATSDFSKMKLILRESAQSLDLHEDGTAKELSAFISWILNERFNLFGMVDLEIDCPTKISKLGIFNFSGSLLDTLHSETQADIARFSADWDQSIKVIPLSCYSPIHRSAPLVSLVIRTNTSGGEKRLTIAAGFFTSRAVSDECLEVPILRERFLQVASEQGLIESSHDYKSSAQIIDSLPREEALHLSSNELSKIVSSVLDVATTSESAISIWSDVEFRGVSVLLVIAQDCFDSWIKTNIERALSKHANAEIKLHIQHLMISNRGVVRLHGRLPGLNYTNEQLQEIQSECINLARSWMSSLEDSLANRFDRNSARKIARRYKSAFSDEYREVQEISDAINDIAYIEELADEHPFAIGCFNDSERPSTATVVIYSRNQSLTISRALPVLENSGLEVLDHRSWTIAPSNSPVIYSNRFTVRTRSHNPIVTDRFSRCVTPGIINALATGRDNDILNSLLLEAGLSLRAVAVLRTYCRLLWQVKRFASRFSIYRALANYPRISQLLWSIFETKFDPSLSLTVNERSSKIDGLNADLVAALRDISDVNTDRIFRSILSLLTHTVRTNVYRNWSTIALKINSQQVDIMPPPRPLYEIFVCSATVEGVHLRAGSVARGGLRWSDRHDDFRSEVLGLVKTQRIKNALIVPTGAKGGFILRQAPKDPTELSATVERSYSEYIRALLSITDTIKDGKVIRPPSVISYEGDDPYLVVAADKGTATFSDIANSIACDEFNFWLGDAFASGGSQGYDHKKYGITARGAWECVLRHGRDRGMDLENEPFTAVGIGDMAGDVFGNGLLLSRQYKLLAAFNHKHIFIDPSPDPEASFIERERLFNLPRSQWSDYSESVLSKGGAIYNRFEKEIRLSPEARASLGIPIDAPEAMDGETLITFILKAPVDLIWNGGIGTYFKSATQSHAEVNDGSNDGVRINASEIRAKMIGEGGNLGMTQSARIDFGLIGGGVNTDAIDNSAGVDLSDHEVNLKILFSDLVRTGKLAVAERNKILKDVAEDVCQSVLQHNRSHALLLTLAAAGSRSEMQLLSGLIHEISQLGYVNRALENLPDEDKLRERVKNGQGLMRPELAVCIAAVKLWVKEIFLTSNFKNDAELLPILAEYFPTKINSLFPDNVRNHPLGENILASQIANTLVDGLGITGFYRIVRETSCSPSAVLFAALSAESILKTRDIRRYLIESEGRIGTRSTIALASVTSKALNELTLFFVKSHAGEQRIKDLLEPYNTTWEVLTNPSFTSDLSEQQTSQFSRLLDLQIPPKMSKILVLLDDVVTFFELMKVARSNDSDIGQLLAVYRILAEELQITSIFQEISKFETKSRWERELLSDTISEIRNSLSELTIKIHRTLPYPLELTEEQRQKLQIQQWRSMLEELKVGQLEVAALAVVTKNLREITSRFS